MVGMLAFWGAIIVLVIIILRLLFKQPDPSETDPIEILKARYARGEIDKEEYQERLKELTSEQADDFNE